MTRYTTLGLLITLLLLTGCGDPATDATLQRSRETPEWFNDAKLGVFIHWGPASVPAFAYGPTLAPGKGFYVKYPSFEDNDYVAKYKLLEDQGRFDVTGKEADRHLFKVPTLRNVALTAPYFHNGSVATLDEAVRVMGSTQLNKDLSDQQVADIGAFLNALTGEFPDMTLPRLPGTPGWAFSYDDK